MPTVLRVGAFSFGFYSNDHEPAHVHCKNGDGTVTIRIDTAEMTDRDGAIRDRDMRRAEALVAEYQEVLQRAWDDFAKRKGSR